MAVKRVAVIGAGISGVTSAAHLKNAGLDVSVYERAPVSGGVWVYNEIAPIEPKYPANEASKGEDFSHFKGRKDDGFDAALKHAPPSPCYDGLTNNIATPLLRTTLNAWPTGTADFVNHRVIKQYIQDTSKVTGVESLTTYGASVTNLEKYGAEWHLTYRTLENNSSTGDITHQDQTKAFDYVVIASGHYHAPRVPDIPGLKEWKSRYPNRVTHSKSYRSPDQYKGKNVLLIGAGTSSTDIARELGTVAKTVYQSARDDSFFSLPTVLLPPNTIRIGEIDTFNSLPTSPTQDFWPNDNPIPSKVNLRSGEKLCDIDAIIVCTGYHITLPFLPYLHSDTTPAREATETMLVTDGTQLHNLHKDIFYIPDPTLVFVGVPYFTATFTLFEFQALTVAAVFSGIASLPSTEAMRKEFAARVAAKGYGKSFHSLKDVEVEYVNELLDWVNSDAKKKGVHPIEGHTAEWHKGKEAQVERFAKMFEASANEVRTRDIIACS